MKKIVLLGCVVCAFFLSACQVNSNYEEEVIRDHVEVKDEQGIEVVADVTMNDRKTKLLVIEVAQDCTATLVYSYHTKGTSGVTLGYYPEKEKGETISLKARKEKEYMETWDKKEITLKKGVNGIYLIGEDNQNCVMNLKVEGVDPTNVLYTGLHLHIWFYVKYYCFIIMKWEIGNS